MSAVASIRGGAAHAVVPSIALGAQAERKALGARVWTIELAFAVLTLLGLALVWSASSAMALARHGSSSHFFVKQLVWALLACVGFFAASRTPLPWIRRGAGLALPLLSLALVYLLIPGVAGERGGATRWIVFHGVSLQPGEPTKVALVLFLARWLARRPAPRGGPGADQADERPAAQQQHPAGDQQHGDDVGADPLKQRRRRPIEGLADRPAVTREEVRLEHLTTSRRGIGPEPERLGGEGEKQARDEEQYAGVDRSGVADQGPDHERQSNRGDEHRQRVGDGADRPGQRHLDAGPGRATIPARVEDEAEVEAERQQSEPDQVEVALLELPRRARLRLLRGLARGRPLPPLAGDAAAALASAQ